MSNYHHSGPAFPVHETPDSTDSPGMTLRDYFAAKAMQAMVQGHFSHYGHDNYWPRDQIAAEAGEMADAMLKERAK